MSRPPSCPPVFPSDQATLQSRRSLRQTPAEHLAGGTFLVPWLKRDFFTQLQQQRIPLGPQSAAGPHLQGTGGGHDSCIPATPHTTLRVPRWKQHLLIHASGCMSQERHLPIPTMEAGTCTRAPWGPRRPLSYSGHHVPVPLPSSQLLRGQQGGQRVPPIAQPGRRSRPAAARGPAGDKGDTEHPRPPTYHGRDKADLQQGQRHQNTTAMDKEKLDLRTHSPWAELRSAASHGGTGKQTGGQHINTSKPLKSRPTLPPEVN